MADREARRERARVYMKAYREHNKERIAAQTAAWRKEHRDQILERKRDVRRCRTPEQVERERARDRECSLAYYYANHNRLRGEQAKYRAAHREESIEYGRRYYEANADKWPEKRRAWNEANKEKVRAIGALHARKRRRLCRQSPEHHSLADIRLLFVLQEAVCYYCPASLRDYYEVDHIVALTRGGDNSAANIALTCRHCNRSKHNKSPLEWLASRRAA